MTAGSGAYISGGEGKGAGLATGAEPCHEGGRTRAPRYWSSSSKRTRRVPDPALGEGGRRDGGINGEICDGW